MSPHHGTNELSIIYYITCKQCWQALNVTAGKSHMGMEVLKCSADSTVDP